MHKESHPLIESIHVCDKSGVPNPYEWEINPDVDQIVDRFAMTAIGRVLYALTQVREYCFGMAWDIAKEHLPSRQWVAFESYASIYTDLAITHQDASCKVASLVAHNVPERLGSLESMLAVAMAEAGFCCEVAADNFIADEVGKWDQAALARLPGFELERLTLAGARKYHEERKMPGGPTPVLSTVPVASMAQDDPISIITVGLVLPPDFSPDRLPDRLDLNDAHTAAFLGLALGYGAE